MSLLFVVPAAAPYTSAQHLFLSLVTLAAGQRTKAHVHEQHESAHYMHYMLSGAEVELWSGPRLEQREVARPGDYLFTPAAFVAARNDATAQESVSMRPELDALVP